MQVEPVFSHCAAAGNMKATIHTAMAAPSHARVIGDIIGVAPQDWTWCAEQTSSAKGSEGILLCYQGTCKSCEARSRMVGGDGIEPPTSSV